jgi:fructose-1,6-bisphosphatase/inositol monophosphatase family enzyme
MRGILLQVYFTYSGVILVREAGGFVGNYEGDDCDVLKRDLVCVRGTVGEIQYGTPELVKVFRSFVKLSEYDRD